MPIFYSCSRYNSVFFLHAPIIFVFANFFLLILAELREGLRLHYYDGGGAADSTHHPRTVLNSVKGGRFVETLNETISHWTRLDFIGKFI